jgi:hypothetical protein
MHVMYVCMKISILLLVALYVSRYALLLFKCVIYDSLYFEKVERKNVFLFIKRFPKSAPTQIFFMTTHPLQPMWPDLAKVRHLSFKSFVVNLHNGFRTMIIIKISNIKFFPKLGWSYEHLINFPKTFWSHCPLPACRGDARLYCAYRNPDQSETRRQRSHHVSGPEKIQKNENGPRVGLLLGRRRRGAVQLRQGLELLVQVSILWNSISTEKFFGKFILFKIT